MTLPLINPSTGEVEHYMLVKMQSGGGGSGSVSPSHSASARRSTKHSLSEGSSPSDDSLDLSLELGHYLQRSDPNLKDSLMNVSFGSLHSVDDDSDRAWSPSPQRKRVLLVSGDDLSPPSKSELPALAGTHSRSTSTGGTPSLVNGSVQSVPSTASLNPVFSPPQGTPTHLPEGALPSPFVRRDDLSQDFDPDLPSRWTGARCAIGIGLGIVGLVKEDGSQFDGLGLLPRGANDCSPNFDDDHWGWAREGAAANGDSARDPGSVSYAGSESIDVDVVDLRPCALCSDCLTPDSDTEHDPEHAPDEHDRVFLAHIHTENPPQPAKRTPYLDSSGKRLFFVGEDDDADADVFLSRPGFPARNTPGLAINGIPVASRAHLGRDLGRPTITSSLKGPMASPEKDSEAERRPVWRP